MSLPAGQLQRKSSPWTSPELTFEVRYRFPSRQAFDHYEQEIAPRLRAEGLKRFPPEKGISYRRSVGEVVNVFPG